MNELMEMIGRYQFYLVPLGVGLAVGFLAVATGSVALRRRRRQAEAVAEKKPEFDPFVQGSLTESRKSCRRNGNPVEVIFAAVDNKHNTRNAVVLDRSVGGLRLGVDEEIPGGTRLLVLPVRSGDMIPWTEVEVCSCFRVGDSWEAGCRFVKTPPWSILLMFG